MCRGLILDQGFLEPSIDGIILGLQPLLKPKLSSLLKAVVRVFIVPLIGTLIMSHSIFHVIAGVNPELAILATGLVASALIGIIFLTPVFLVVSRFRRLFISWKSILYAALAGAILALLGALPYGTFNVLEILPAMLVLQTILVSPMLMTWMLTCREDPQSSG
jgi:hypothetical protein